MTRSRPSLRRVMSLARTPIATALAAAACVIAPSVAAARSGGWFDDDGNHQFNASSYAGSTHAYSTARSVDGKVSGSPCYLEDHNASVRYDLSWPQTAGVVELFLSKVRIAFSDVSQSHSFVIHVTTDADPATASWTLVYSGQSAVNQSGYQTFTFPSTPVRHVRLTYKGTGWMNLQEVDFFGSIDQDAEAAAFLHPGTHFTQAGLDEQKARITAGTHTAGVTFSELASRWPATPRTPAGPAYLDSRAGWHTGWTELAADADAAYEHAMMWAMTGQAVYAENVIAVLDAWDGAEVSSASHNALGAGLQLAAFFQAIDLLKHYDGGYSGWDASVEANFMGWVFDSMFIHLEGRNHVGASNWETNLIRTNLTLAILLDNRYQFDRFVELWKRNISRTVQSAPWGENGETCRDFPHALMNLSGHVGAAEIAWAQGVDLYSWSSTAPRVHTPTGVSYTDADFLGYRLANIVDYHAQIYNVGQSTTPFPININNHAHWDGVINWDNGPVNGAVGEVGRVGGFEVAYNHYKNRLGVELPALKQRIDYTRANNARDGLVHASGWGTITHADLGPSPAPTHRWKLDNSFVDAEGGATGTAFGSPTFTTHARVGSHALDIPGGSFVDVGTLDLGDRFTLTLWTQFTAGYNIRPLIANSSGGFSTNGFRFYVNNWQSSNRRIVFETGSGSAGDSAYTADDAFIDGQWNHLAVVVDRPAGTARIYLNGQDVTVNDTIRPDFATSNVTKFGRLGSSTYQFDGLIDDARIYDRTLSASEVAALASH